MIGIAGVASPSMLCLVPSVSFPTDFFVFILPLDSSEVRDRAGSWNKMIRSKSSNTNHGKASILQFLQFHFLLRSGILRPNLQKIYSWFGTTQETLPLKLRLIFPEFKNTT